MPRYQTRRVYAAEDEYIRKYAASVDMSKEEVEGLVDRIIRSVWWSRRCAIPSIEVSWHNRVWMWFHKPTRILGIPPNRTIRPIDVTHELAHGIYYSRDKEPHHAPKWVKAHLTLIGKWLGREARLRMEEIYGKHGVDW